MSSAAGVELVRQAKRDGLDVTCDVSINSLHLTENDIGYFDSRARLMPPLRQQRDRDALCAGLRDGTIDALVSDHNPVDADAKDLPFAQARWCGAEGVDKAQTLSDYRDRSFGLATGTLVDGLMLLTRAVFIVDENGKVQYAQYVPEITQHPDYEAAYRVLAELTGK